MISKGLATCLRQTAVLLVAFGGSWMGPMAIAQVTGTEVDQTVDQLEVFSSNKVLRLKFDSSPTKLVGLTTAPPNLNLRACQTSNANGLFCLDGQVVRRWATTTEHPIPPTSAISPDNGDALFSCSDTAFGFVAGNPCTTMTVDSKGGVWLAGQKTATTFNLVKVLKKNTNGPCPSSTPTPLVQSPDYCFGVHSSGRARITDLSPVEGALVEGYFTEGEGVLGVEGGAAVVFYPYSGAPLREFNSGWPEPLQSATILQRQETTGPTTYVLITGASGRVYFRDLTNSGATTIFVHANAEPGNDPDGIRSGNACASGLVANQFKVRASETSGRVFVTNRNYCLAYVLTPLPNMLSVDPSTFEIVSTTADYRPDGLLVAPGVAINVGDCTGGSLVDLTGSCNVLDAGDDNNDYPAVRMYEVNLEPNSPTGLRVFKVESIPDCRYILAANTPLPPGHPCLTPGVVVNDPKVTDGTQSFPQRQYLNVTPMLPATVTNAFDASGKKPTGLPPLLIQPRYRAQQGNDFIFEALFGIADPNIRFRKTFTIEFDISDFNLAGVALGCGVHQAPTPQRFNEWDIGTVVSERYSSVGGPRGIVKDTTTITGQPVVAEHVDTMINKGCYNPTPKAGTRWSMYSYNLELAEDTPVRSSPSGPVTGFAYSRAVTYLANLLLSLHTELGAAQRNLACQSVDATGNSAFLAPKPLPAATCTLLQSKWTAANNAMKSCATASSTAASYPTTVCNDFYNKFLLFKTEAEGAASSISGPDADPANRAGELWSRTDVIKHVFNDHFKKAWTLGAAADAQ